MGVKNCGSYENTVSTKISKASIFNSCCVYYCFGEEILFYLLDFYIPLGIVLIAFIVFINIYEQSWTYNYYNNIIIVINRTYTGELIINGQTFDKKSGLKQATLRGKLESGEEVVAHIVAGYISVVCNLKIDGKIISYTKRESLKPPS